MLASLKTGWSHLVMPIHCHTFLAILFSSANLNPSVPSCLWDVVTSQIFSYSFPLDFAATSSFFLFTSSSFFIAFLLPSSSSPFFFLLSNQHLLSIYSIMHYAEFYSPNSPTVCPHDSVNLQICSSMNLFMISKWVGYVFPFR